MRSRSSLRCVASDSKAASSSWVSPPKLERLCLEDVRVALGEALVVVRKFAGGQHIVFEQRDEDFSPFAELEFDEFFPHQAPERCEAPHACDACDACRGAPVPREKPCGAACDRA